MWSQITYFLSNWQWFFLLLGSLIFIHELGHFLVAKACGIRVLRFCLGMGPRILTYTRGHTEYALALFPIGGYIKMYGESLEAATPELQHVSFAHKALWQRSLVVFAGPLFNFLLALVINWGLQMGTHEVGDTKLGWVGRLEPAWQAGLREGDQIVQINQQKVTDWATLKQAIQAQPNQDLMVHYQRDGNMYTTMLKTQTHAGMNEFLESENQGHIGISLQFVKPVVAVLDVASPAYQAGVRSGDRVVALGGQAVASWHELKGLISKLLPDQSLELTLERHGQHLPISVKPATSFPAGLRENYFSSLDTSYGYTGMVAQETIVQRVDSQTPAGQIGLQPQDRLLKIAYTSDRGMAKEHAIGVWSLDLLPIDLDTHRRIELTFQRQTAVYTKALTLEEVSKIDVLKMVHRVTVFGAYNDANCIDLYVRRQWIGPIDALGLATAQVGSDASLIVRGIGKLVRGDISRRNLGGPILLFVVAEQSAKYGWSAFLQTASMISVNLGVVNLLPIPVLDGGYLMFFALEGLLGTTPSVRWRMAAQMLGLMVLLATMLGAVFNDLLRFFGT